MINKNDLISIIVKPTNACNLRCKHCYHAGTGYDNEQMSDKMLEKLISSSVPHFSGIHYIWHGGEPLSMPLTFYKRALELEQKYKHNPNQNINNSMQSNGTYVTEDVAKFIADNNILIGFSFEGPYNDFLRSHTNMTLKGYENLKKYNPDILIVTGHDAMLKKGTNYNNIYNYRNSRHFINTVKEARRWGSSSDKLVIFAGACQSFYEAIIASGADFASSPGRILIDFVDPLIVAEKIAIADECRFVTSNEISREIKEGVKGVSGVGARGKKKIIG